MKSIQKIACGKINLGLQVIGRRPDGYHEINTIFAPICLADLLTISHSSNLQIDCIPSLGIEPGENIVSKAVALLSKRFPDLDLGCRINLQKSIPIGAGLGGGSSDAAAALLALTEYFDLPLTKDDLEGLAIRLGSDVPYFLGNGLAKATGRGEQLEYFDFDIPLSILLVNPNIHISTAWAYGRLNIASGRKESADFKQALLDSAGNPEILSSRLFNDFEPLVFESYPIVREIKEAMYSSGAAIALMSGSGSTVYGLFDSPEKTLVANKLFGKYWTHFCLYYH